MEFIDILQKVPETERRSRDASAYQPSEWVPSTRRSPVPLRNRCEPARPASRADEGDSESGNDDEDMQSPTQHIQRGRGHGLQQAICEQAEHEVIREAGGPVVTRAIMGRACIES